MRANKNDIRSGRKKKKERVGQIKVCAARRAEQVQVKYEEWEGREVWGVSVPYLRL